MGAASMTPRHFRWRKIRKIGMNSSDTGLIYFDGVRVPQRYRIGAEGGLCLSDAAVSRRAPVGRGQLFGVAEPLHRLDMEWAHERKLFGATLADQQWVQFKLAELKTEVESLRA